MKRKYFLVYLLKHAPGHPGEKHVEFNNPHTGEMELETPIAELADVLNIEKRLCRFHDVADCKVIDWKPFEKPE